MNNLIESQIIKAEERLRLAMLQSDVNTLDELLAPDLIFTNHLGHILTKQDDLEAHRSGLLKIEVLTPSEENIQLMGDVAIVTVKAHILGRYADTSSEADFRFTRIWAATTKDSWQIVTAHSCIIVA